MSPELSPTFSKKDDELIEILGIFIRVLDGKGYESDTGAHGHRGYVGEFMFVWLGPLLTSQERFTSIFRLWDLNCISLDYQRPKKQRKNI